MLSIYLLIALCFLYFLYFLYRINRLRKDHRQLRSEFVALDKRLSRLEHGTADTETSSVVTDIADEIVTGKIEVAAGASSEIPTWTARKPEAQAGGKKTASATGSRAAAKTEASPQAKPRKTRSDWWQKIEKQFIENWTGILGAVIMVMGVGFFGIYAALKLSPFIRFLQIVAFAGALFGIFLYLRKRPQWLKLGLWLRSSAGAIFIFACFGASAIPGLQWIESSTPALMMLTIGILVNLYLGYIGSSQAFASLHVLLSLVALGTTRSADLTLLMGAMVAVFGVALTYREKWDQHLLLTIASFFIFHLKWYFELGPLTEKQNLLGIVTVLLVGVPAAVVHYREAYRSQTLQRTPFAVHLLNWFFLGLGLMVHSTGSHWKTLFLAAGAIAAFMLAKRARKLGIKWLHQTDTLIAQLTAIIALVTLVSWEVETGIVLGLIFAECLLFKTIMLCEQEQNLYRVGCLLAQLAGVAILLFSLDLTASTGMYMNSGLLTASLVLGTAFHVFAMRKNSPAFESIEPVLGFVRTSYSGMGLLIGLFALVAYFNLHTLAWAQYAFALIVVVLLYIRQRIESDGLQIGILLAALNAHLLLWVRFSSGAISDGVGSSLLQALPMFVISTAGWRWAFMRSLGRQLAWPWIYLLFAHLAASAYFVFGPVSALLPGVMWLTLSLVALEMANMLRSHLAERIEQFGFPDRFVLHAGYLFVAAFICRHLLVHLQVEQYWGSFNIRVLIELYALAVFGYWAWTKAPTKEPVYKSWTHLKPWFAELILGSIVFMIALEVSEYWYAIDWVILAAACLIAGNWLGTEFSRLRLYAVLFNWAAAFQVAFLSSSYLTPSTSMLDQSWLSAVVAILLQFGFIYSFYRYGKLAEVDFPTVLKFWSPITLRVQTNLNRWLLYPVVACVTLFLYWSFDKSILTVLWVVECFCLIVLGLLLRERQFRHIALAGIAISVGRLILYDLSQANIITRAVVFVLVGIILLGINAIFNKFRERFVQ